MKKIIVLLLIVTMMLGCLACGRGPEQDSQTPSNSQTENSQTPDGSQETENSTETEAPSQTKPEITDAKEILDKAWAKYQDNEKFAAVGGHYNSYTDGAPAKYDITQVADIEAVFCIPTEVVAMFDDVASLQHGMNVNNFSAMACHLKEGADMQAIVEAIKNKTVSNQWICGHPDRLVIITIGEEYLVTAFGNGEIVDNFRSKVLGLYNNLPEVVVDQDL